MGNKNCIVVEHVHPYRIKRYDSSGKIVEERVAANRYNAERIANIMSNREQPIIKVNLRNE